MKAIQLRKTTIDIPFMDGEKELFTLHFDRSDKNIERLYNDYDELIKNTESITEETPLEEVKPFVKDFTDSILGEGSFDKLYEISPSLQIVMIYIMQITIGIKEEVEQEDIKDLEKQLLG